jgi:hypothetical protein
MTANKENLLYRALSFFFKNPCTKTPFNKVSDTEEEAQQKLPMSLFLYTKAPKPPILPLQEEMLPPLARTTTTTYQRNPLLQNVSTTLQNVPDFTIQISPNSQKNSLEKKNSQNYNRTDTKIRGTTHLQNQ